MRGINAIQEDSVLLEAQKSSLIPCYIGSAPYWHVDRADWATIAGDAFIINSLDDAKAKIGFFKPTSGRWDKHSSLCEAVYAHFGDKLNAVGPIIVLINAASVTVATEPTTVSVPISNGVGSIAANGLGILNTVAITGKVKGVDYTAAYDANGRSIVITDLKKALGSTASVTYSAVTGLDTLDITSATFDAIDFFEQTIGAVPTVFAAPGWQDDTIDGIVDGQTIGAKLMDLAEGKINSHWYTQAYSQLSSATRDLVAAEKATKGYDSPKIKVCWPFAKKDGLVYEIATKFIVAKMKVDISNDQIPYESASNEILNIDGLCSSTGTVILQTEAQANALNDIGIATCNFAQGSWRTWGVCMANYLESNKDNILPEYLNDVAVQMRDYVCNDFQADNFDYVDKPIPVRQAKEIVDDYQLKMNSLVNVGALLYANIAYNAVENPVSALANGEFVFSLGETNTPPGKLIVGKVQYTAEGLSTYNSGEDN